MSELEITSGGIISVDTDALRQAACSWREFAARVGHVVRLLRSIPVTTRGTTASGLADAAERVHMQAAQIDFAFEETAVLYEIVEARVAQEAAVAAGDVETAARLSRRLEALVAANPERSGRVDHLFARWNDGRNADLIGQTAAGAVLLGMVSVPAAVIFGSVMGLAWTGIRLLDKGTPTGSRSPVAAPVALTSVVPTRAVAPLHSTEAAITRVPGGDEKGDGRVRVEKYVMPDGSAEFVVYSRGLDPVPSSSEPFGYIPAWDLYMNEQGSASSEAIKAALKESGAHPGDVIHGIGHSLGGMSLAQVAAEGEYRFGTVVSVGTPVEASFPIQTTSVQIRHTDDVVGGLSDGGRSTPTGSPESFVVQRSYDPLPTPPDIVLASHQLPAYTETAAMIDASTDPRVDALRHLYAHLGTADSVTATVYGAVRLPDSTFSPREEKG